MDVWACGRTQDQAFSHTSILPYSHTLILLLLIGSALAGAGTARAQEAPSTDTTETRRVEILAADSLTGAVGGEAGVQQLIGNVRLRQGETNLRARRAIRYLARDEVLLLGDVLITEAGDSLRADSVRYDTRRKVGRATGHVRLTDGDVTVRGPAARYFTEEERAEFERGVTLVDSAHVLTSRRGTYFTEEERAEFAGAVRLLGEREYLEADSVTYLREERRTDARGHVFVERLGDEEEDADQETAGQARAGRDSLEAGSEAGSPEAVARRLRQIARIDSLWARPDTLARPLALLRAGPAAADTTARTLLFGARILNDEPRRYSRVTGEALLVRLQADQDSAGQDSAAAAPLDTLVLASRRMETLRTDSLERLIAVEHVRIWQQDLAAVADSAVYVQRAAADSTTSDSTARDSLAERSFEREETRLFRQPMAWTAQGQLSGDTIRITGRNRAVDSLFAYSNAFVAQRDTALDRIHQLRGRDLLGLFSDDSLRYLRVRPNAESIRFMQGEDGALSGAVQASADQVEFWLEAGELERVTFGSGVQGRQYRAEAMPATLELQGFVWRPGARPTRLSLLDRPAAREHLDLPAPPPGAPSEPTPPAAAVQRNR